MKAIVNLPSLDEDVRILEERVAMFHATLLIERIKQLNVDDISKEKILKSILEYLSKDGVSEKELVTNND